ncbi:MAG: magnesium transporter [Candidatus Bathyarchaeia archaeon]
MLSLNNHRAFFRSLKETLTAYSFDVLGLFAGFMVASQLNVFQLSPWAIAIYPAIVSAKGVIGGLLSGRLSTALHLGTIHPRMFRNTQYFYHLIRALIVVTLATSVMMSMVSLFFGLAFWGITLAEFPEILLNVIATMSIGLTLTIVTMKVAFVTFKRKLDPDVIVYPLMSTIADIFITFCYILVLNLFFLTNLGKYTLIIIGILHVVVTVFFLVKYYKNGDFAKTLKESLLTMVFVAVIVNVTGSVLKQVSLLVEDRKEVYTIYPAMIDMTGDVGAVIGSTATTKLALGTIKPTLLSIKQHTTQIFSAWIASTIIAVFLAIISLLINGILTISALINLASLLLITNMIAGASITMLAYGISIVTFKKGLDPDNFVIPVESSFADSLTSISLLIAIVLLGQSAG